MAALPYIQLYVADYLADTMHLTAEEHGAYLLLIMNYWQTGKPIPIKRLQAICRVPNDRWIAVKNTLSEYFTETEQNEWKHDRVEKELDKVKAKSRQASAAGKASAAKRATAKQQNNHLKSTVYNERSTDAERGSNHTDTDTDTDTDNNNSAKCRYTFDDFYGKYPLKKNKQAAIKAWKKLSIEDKTDAVEKYDNYIKAKKPDVAFCHPATYLNNKRWEDELESNVIPLSQPEVIDYV